MRGFVVSRRPHDAVFFLLFAAAGAALVAAGAGASELPLDQLRVPEGFRIELFAADVPEARQMARGAQGTIFTGSRRLGQVHAVVDADGDGRAERVVQIAEGLYMPSGLTFRDGSLWVAEVHRILRYDDIENSLDQPPEPVVVVDDLPDDRHHGWKFIAFGPDDHLYVPVGAPCNVCDREDPYATILRMKPDGSERSVYARGVRNTVGFDWRPGTSELWFADNGRDMLGDDIPPDELNRVTEAGQHFGFPYCHAGTLLDGEFGEGKNCDDYVAPAVPLDPHVAAIGMRFYTGEQFPEAYRGKVFIAEHGSWNRSKKIGYRVVTVDIDDEGNASNYSDFATGWLQGEKAWGRPADVLVQPDGSLLISDDAGNAIYRVTWQGDVAEGAAP